MKTIKKMYKKKIYSRKKGGYSRTIKPIIENKNKLGSFLHLWIFKQLINYKTNNMSRFI